MGSFGYIHWIVIAAEALLVLAVPIAVITVIVLLFRIERNTRARPPQ